MEAERNAMGEHRDTKSEQSHNVQSILMDLTSEVGKIYCNVSMLELQLGKAHLALDAAEVAVNYLAGAFKPKARRGLALVALGRFGDAALAFEAVLR